MTKGMMPETDKLSRQAFQNATAFMRQKARPVDRAVFEAQFGDGSRDDILDALEPYQNADGGFGHALEPDFCLPHSSVLATTIAFQFLIEADAAITHPLVRGGLDFLLRSLDEDTLSWQAVPPEVDAFPRAPWWKYENWKRQDLTHWINPGAECVGIFYYYSVYIPPDLLSRLAARVGVAIRAMPDKLEPHDFQCYKRLAQWSPVAVQAVLLPELKARVRGSVALTRGEWSTYGVPPNWVVSGPRDPFHEDLEVEIDDNLTFEISRQGEDGAWEPIWAWNNDFQAEWETAKAEWKGVLTLRLLRVLRAYGRIEGLAPKA